MNFRSASACSLLCALSVLLGGCSISSMGKSPDVRWYVLQEPAAASAPLSGARIGVVPPALPGYLDRPQIVERSADGVTVSVLQYDRWGEDLSAGAARVLCSALTGAGRPAVVVKTGTRTDAKLLLEIRRLDGEPDGEARLDAVWTLQNDGTVLRSGHAVLTRPAGPGVASLVGAESQLLRDLAAQIAAKLPGRI